MSAWGKHIPDLESLQRQGFPIAALQDRPLLRDDLATVWQAFNDLHRSRTVGLTANPIQWESVSAWLDLHGYVDPEIRLEYAVLIMEMDDEWLGEYRAKEAAGNTSGKPPTHH